jgi:hypothetical protein
MHEQIHLGAGKCESSANHLAVDSPCLHELRAPGPKSARRDALAAWTASRAPTCGIAKLRRYGVCDRRPELKGPMSETVRMQLHNPLITLLGAFGVLVIGIVIGIHWRPPTSTVVWMAATGALLIVLHDLLYAFAWTAFTSECIRRSRLRQP